MQRHPRISQYKKLQRTLLLRRVDPVFGRSKTKKKACSSSDQNTQQKKHTKMTKPKLAKNQK